MDTTHRLSVHELNQIVRQHRPDHYVYERAQIEDMRERVANYGLQLSRALSDRSVLLTRLNNVVAVHDAARARKDYATSDALRAALDVSWPFDTSPRERAEAYNARFEVILGDRLIHFLATPPKP